MAIRYLEFEKPIEELEKRIEELRSLSSSDYAAIEEIRRLTRRVDRVLSEIYANLSPWQTTLAARHPDRPYTLDYAKRVFEDFIELHGDRLYKDDPAIVGGLANLDGRGVVFIGQQKGRNTKERIYRNYGMPHPEGYRKALRLMELSERFKKPLVTFVDTPGAAPDIEAEERGQSEAIARNLITMSRLRTPIISVVVGEGGSGGALAIAVADKVFMLEHSIYSVISPEGCAAILWKDAAKAELASKALKMGAKELFGLGVIDGIIKEPLGGSHRDYDGAAKFLKNALIPAMDELSAMPIEKLLKKRYQRFRNMGVFKA